MDWIKLIVGTLATAGLQFGTTYAANGGNAEAAGVAAGINAASFIMAALGIHNPMAAPPRVPPVDPPKHLDPRILP